MNWIANTIDALWISKERGLLKDAQVRLPKVHPVHHLLHLAYGSLILALSIGAHVLISDRIINRPKPSTVHWQAGQVQNNYVPIASKPVVGKVEFGIMEDGTVTWRVVP